jgi:hypothetical protein
MILFKNIMVEKSSGKGSVKQLEFLAAGLQIMFWVRQCNVGSCGVWVNVSPKSSLAPGCRRGLRQYFSPKPYMSRNVYCSFLDLVKKNIPISDAYREFQITLKKNILYYLEWRSAQELPFPE